MGKKSPKKPGHNAAGQEEVSSSARDCNDVQQSSQDEMEDMDVAEALVLLQELRGKDKSSNDESGVEHSGVELAADNPDVRTEFDAAINLLSLTPKRNSASADLNGGTAKCANEALLVEETELTRNDDGQRLVDCPESSVMMELQQPKLDFKVSDNSENQASDDAQGGINDASGKHTSLTEPMTREADQEPEQKLDASEEQAAKGSTSVDEPGTDNPGEESGAPNSHEVLTSCSGKSSCSVGSDKGDVIIDDTDKLAACALLELRYGKNSRQGLAAKAYAIELEEPKLDHEVPDNSVVMQEEEQKVDLVAPAPTDSSEEERSDIIDGQENQTA